MAAADRAEGIERDGLPVFDPDATVEETVKGLVAQLTYADTDPRALMAAMAVRVSKEVDLAPSASLVTVLRSLLNDITAFPNSPHDGIDEIRLRHLTKQVNVLLGGRFGRFGHTG
jgi:hypothetical protein